MSSIAASTAGSRLRVAASWLTTMVAEKTTIFVAIPLGRLSAVAGRALDSRRGCISDLERV